MELAECQAGNSPKTESQQPAHAHGGNRGADGKQNKSPGINIEKVVSNLAAQVNEFSKASKDIKTLAEAVYTLSQDVKTLKRKNEGKEDQPEPKRACLNSNNESYLDSMSSPPNPEATTHSDSEVEISDDELDSFMDSSHTESPEDEYGELEEFFQPEDGIGEAVNEKIAGISEKALRGPKTKKEDEKLQKLKEKHLRPKNIQNLQIPKVDDGLWRQLKREVKTIDYMQQKAIANYDKN